MLNPRQAQLRPGSVDTVGGKNVQAYIELLQSKVRQRKADDGRDDATQQGR
jgi:hypothetical protein